MTECVLITGASSGLGLEFAKIFAKSGSRLILTARSEDKLESLAVEVRAEHSATVDVIACDLAKPDGVNDLMAEIKKRNLDIDVLVNNAGFGELGEFVSLPIQRQLNMVQLNVMAVTHLARLLLPDMVQRDRGGILNVGSTAAFQPGPNMAVYYATKAYVLSFSEALHEELSDTNVNVTCLAPGPTKTGFGEDSGMEDTIMFKTSAMDAREVAQAGYDAFRKNDPLIVPGMMNKLAANMNRLIPRFVTRKIVKKIQPVPAADGS